MTISKMLHAASAAIAGLCSGDFCAAPSPRNATSRRIRNGISAFRLSLLRTEWCDLAEHNPINGDEDN